MKMTEILTNTGLNLPDNYSEEEFFEAGTFLANVEKGMQWAIGDWYNNIKWGDKKAACERAGLNYHNAVAFAQVAGVFELQYRTVFEFSYYRVLKSGELSTDQRRQLLDLAQHGDGEGKPWTVKRLTDERDKLLGVEPTETVKGLSKKMDVFRADLQDVLPASLSKKVIRHVEAEIKKVSAAVAMEFEQQVKRAAAKLKGSLIQEYTVKLEDLREEQDQLHLAQKRVNFFMSQEEFKLIRSCLHSDTSASPEKMNKAFTAFNRLSDTVKASEQWGSIL